MPAALLAAVVAVTATTAAPVYVAVGDSTGVGMGARDGGYPARLAARARREGRAVRLVNLCVSGARAEDLARAQLEAALAEKPAVVTLGIGINDVVNETQPVRFGAEIERIGLALAGTGARVVVVTIPDLALSPLAVGATRAAVRARTRELNARLEAVARRHGFAVADLYAAGRAVYGGAGTLSPDRFHPSDAGYERWADVLAPTFLAALPPSDGAGEPGLSAGPTLR